MRKMDDFFIELLKRDYTIDIGKLDSKEINFIARKVDEILYIQVAFEISENTQEIDNFLHIKDNYNKILITENIMNKPLKLFMWWIGTGVVPKFWKTILM